jgi:hypothetical protein
MDDGIIDITLGGLKSAYADSETKLLELAVMIGQLEANSTDDYYDMHSQFSLRESAKRLIKYRIDDLERNDETYAMTINRGI